MQTVVVNFHFRGIMGDETDAEIADVSNGGRRGRLQGVRVMAAASYFFREIANYLQMLQSATNM